VYQGQGYGMKMLGLLEKWIKRQGRNILKLHAHPHAVSFYRKLGYSEMLFPNDISLHKDSVDLGKEL
jgi:GNAT superfamily N-acetyltransferase